jgi:hypothetical protein
VTVIALKVPRWLLVRMPWRPTDPSTKKLRINLVRDGGSLRPTRPSRRWRTWTNAALQSQVDVDSAVREIEACGLVPHQDRPKNWDLFAALGVILDRCRPWSPVLEMGAARYSPLLTWLYQFGFWNIRGIDLIYDEPIRRGPIRLDPMDMTRTTFADHTFAAIASLSVVEHGVDIEAYLAEAARLLRPGGVLFTSTDFWCEPIDSGESQAYGHPIHVNDPADIGRFLEIARSHGLTELRRQELSCADRVVTWDRLGIQYTFLAITLVARPRGIRQQAQAWAHGIVG